MMNQGFGRTGFGRDQIYPDISLYNIYNIYIYIYIHTYHIYIYVYNSKISYNMYIYINVTCICTYRWFSPWQIAASRHRPHASPSVLCPTDGFPDAAMGAQ